jgi:hypothetical protein
MPLFSCYAVAAEEIQELKRRLALVQDHPEPPAQCSFPRCCAVCSPLPPLATPSHPPDVIATITNEKGEFR